MPSYLIEGYLPRHRAGELSKSVARLRTVTEGTRVRHVRSSFLPAEELFLHILEAESAEAAGEAAGRAGIAPERIIEEVPQ